MCEAHVNDALRKQFPEIQNVKSSHKKNETVIISSREYTDEELRSALDKSGYKVISAQSVPYEKKGFSSSENKTAGGCFRAAPFFE